MKTPRTCEICGVDISDRSCKAKIRSSVLSEAIIDGLPTPELGVFLRGGDVSEEAEADHIIDTYPGY